MKRNRLEGAHAVPGGTLVLGLVAVASFALASCASLALAAQPNIVFILADDLGIGDLGVNGQNDRAAAGLPAIATPNLDALAGQSVSFTRMYSTPLCSPSRASLLTGFEIQNLRRDTTDGLNGFRAGAEDETWAQMLQEHGYRTAMYGKWHIGGIDSPTGSLGIYDYNSIPTQKGFEVAYGGMAGGYRTRYLWENNGAGGMVLTPNEYTPSWPGPGLPYKFTEDAQTDRVVRLIKESTTTDPRPFAAYVALQAPHDPFNQVDLGPYASQPWPDVQKQYAAMVSNLDMNVGRIIASIEDPNGDGDKSDSIASNTLIMFASDNGALWNHGSGYLTEYFDSNGAYRGQKSTTLEGGIRTPFYVRWDGVTAPGSVNNDHVGSLADIYPTIAELAGDSAPIGVDGVSMLSAITGQGADRQQDAHVWTARWTFLNQASWAIQMADWKLRRNMANQSYELYQIAADPYETTNLASIRTDIRNALAAVVQLEGALDEPFFATGNQSQPGNVYYTQYKQWEPQQGSSSFNAAGNWAGGTQFNLNGDPQSLNWNSGPARNWLATVANGGNSSQTAVVDAHARVLGLEISGAVATMELAVLPSVRLDAYNGIRLNSGGALRLDNSTIATARELDIRAGGLLTGSGLVTGYQDIIAGIPEFDGRGLLEPEVVNAGVVDPSSSTAAGIITVNGDLANAELGQLRFDLLGSGGAAGVDYDKITVNGDANLAGFIYVDLAAGFIPLPGEWFPVLSATRLQLGEVQLIGPDALSFSAFTAGSDLILSFNPLSGGPFIPGDFDRNGVVDGADLIVWQDNFGQQSGLGDGDNNGVVDGADFLVWQRQYQVAGEMPPSGGASAVPEPTGLTIAAIAIFACCRCSRSRRFCAVRQ